MTIDGWGYWLAAVVMSAWFVSTATAQQPFLLGRAGTIPQGYVGSLDPLEQTPPCQPDSGTAELIRLPPVVPIPVGQTPSATPNPIAYSPPGILSHASSGGRVDGTWQEDGQFLILNLNGQQLRLAKEASPRTDSQASQHVSAASALPDLGEVRGQLSHRGQPLVDCEVTLVPLNKSWLGYQEDRSTKPRVTTTNSVGAYAFAQVPAGPYKLKWRPAGEASWIHHAETRPDVIVRTGETSHAKEVRVALRTIN